MKSYDTGILFVHGIQGKPSQFDYLIEKLPQSVLVRNLLLPGHGATVKEFNRSGREQWISAVREECDKMKEQCKRIVFVGHSMGCLLGLLTEQEEETCDSMLLICCPFYIRPTFRYFRNNFSASFKKGKKDDKFINAARKANGVSAKHAVSYLFCAHPYFELLRLMQDVRRQDPLRIPEKTVFCYSQLDEIVGKKNLLYVKDRLNGKTELLEDSGHNYFTDEAKDHLTRILLDMQEFNEDALAF